MGYFIFSHPIKICNTKPSEKYDNNVGKIYYKKLKYIYFQRRGFMGTKQWQCVDAGSDYCPCHLAEENSCIICTQLQGKGYCDCNWMGVCIYNDFYFSGNRKKEIRRSQEYPVIDSKIINNNNVLTICVTKYMARSLNQTGSNIFVRNKHDDHFLMCQYQLWIVMKKIISKNSHRSSWNKN